MEYILVYLEKSTKVFTNFVHMCILYDAKIYIFAG